MLKDMIESTFLLNMQMIVDELENDYNVVRFYRKNDAQTISGACVYYGQKELLPNFIYVGRSEEFDRSPISSPEICRCCIGHSDLPERDGAPVIEIEAQEHWERVFNSIQAVIYRTTSWANQLIHILNRNAGLYELSIAAMNFFRNPVVIHDENFNILAMPTWVVGMQAYEINKDTGSVTVSLQAVQHLTSSQEYLATLTTKGTQMWARPFATHRMLYCNIWDDHQQYRGRLLINEMFSSLKPSDFVLADYFVGILKIAMDQNQFKSNATVRFEQILRSVLEGEPIEETYLQERLAMVQWDAAEEYICFCICVPDEPLQTQLNKKIASLMGTVLKSSFSFEKGNRVYTVCNLTRTAETEEQCRERLVSLCRSVHAVAGASHRFSPFPDLREYYLQAEKAVALGRTAQPDGCLFLFRDYALNFILTHFTEECRKETVVAREILTLQKIDAERHTEYLRTLQIYLENGMQQTETAQALFIHRSTLLYRLEKMKELAGVDLSTSAKRLYLQISLCLLA